MDKDLGRIEKLYNCNIFKTNLGDQDFLELHTLNVLTYNNLIHIEHIFKQYGFYFYKVEALDDYLVITYYRK